MIFTRRMVEGGQMYPEGYGLAWRLWHRDAAVCYPIPFNLIAGWLRDFWLDLRTPPHLTADLWREGEHYAAFRRGYEAGLAQAAKCYGR